MRHLALAALALSAGACCLDLPDDAACVVSRVPAAPYCYPLNRDDYSCFDEAQRPPPTDDPRGCPGIVHEGDDCADRGFTVRCYGDYYARPGDPC
jgi:hypothetical protein